MTRVAGDLQSSRRRNSGGRRLVLKPLFGIKYVNLNQEGKKLTETARQQIQSAVLSLNTRALSLNTLGPEARDITRLRNQA